MNKRPNIGITPAFDYELDQMYLRSAYYDGIIEAGGLPVLLAITEKDSYIQEYIDMCSGFLISGGPDIDAFYYGEDNLKFIGGISPYRDIMEIKLIKDAVEKNKAVLGICRGCQAINVAMGGTLFQDIYSQTDTTQIRHSQDAPKWHAVHNIKIDKESHMYQIFKEENINVNSFHHQSVKTIGNKLKATAYASDGIIEAIEHTEKNFVVGAQWHPELMWKRHPEFLKLFKYFVEKCKK